jgi:hypothetical protein
MHPWTELDVVASSARIAVERLPGGNAITVIAIFHRRLEKRLAAVFRGSNPHGRPEPVAVDGIDG